MVKRKSVLEQVRERDYSPAEMWKRGLQEYLPKHKFSGQEFTLASLDHSKGDLETKAQIYRQRGWDCRITYSREDNMYFMWARFNREKANRTVFKNRRK